MPGKFYQIVMFVVFCMVVFSLQTPPNERGNLMPNDEDSMDERCARSLPIRCAAMKLRLRQARRSVRI